MIRILLVDDHEIVRRGLRQLLVEAFPDSMIGESNQAAQARNLITKQAWDLVLLDINLPDGSGLDLISELRRVSPGTGVLVVSAYSEAEFAECAFKLGAAGYLTKTSLANEVIAAVNKVLLGGKYVSPSLAETWATALTGAPLQAPHELLSPRELEILRRVATGKTSKEIAAEFFLSEKTVASYRARITQKMGRGTNVELTRYAIQHHLVELD